MFYIFAIMKTVFILWENIIYGAPAVHLRFLFWFFFSQSLVLCLVYCGSLIVLMSFLLVIVLCSSSTYGFWLPSLVSSNFSKKEKKRMQIFDVLYFCGHETAFVLEIIGNKTKAPDKSSFRTKALLQIRGGSRGAPPPLKLEKIWFVGVKSWFFTRNTPKIRSAQLF